MNIGLIIFSIAVFCLIAGATVEYLWSLKKSYEQAIKDIKSHQKDEQLKLKTLKKEVKELQKLTCIHDWYYFKQRSLSVQNEFNYFKVCSKCQKEINIPDEEQYNREKTEYRVNQIAKELHKLGYKVSKAE